MSYDPPVMGCGQGSNPLSLVLSRSTMIPTSRSARRQLLQTVSTTAHAATNVVTKAMGRAVGTATTGTASTSSGITRPAVIARSMLENSYRSSSLIKKLERTYTTGKL